MVVQRHGGSGAGGTVVATGVMAAVGVVLGTVTGCSGNGAAASDQSPQESRAAVRHAADVLARAGTSRVVTAMETDSGGTRVTTDGSGAFDYGERSGRLEVRLPKGAPGARAGERKPVTELVTPGALYMKHRGAGVPEDKWVRVDTASLADGNLVTSGATDPVSAAELLRGARRVTYGGEHEGEDGARVRRYRGSVHLAAAAEAAAPAMRKQLAAAAKGFGADRVPFEADLDDEGRLRKVRYRFTVANGTGGDEVAVTSTVRLDDFGTPVRVVTPEPGDIYTGRIASP